MASSSAPTSANSADTQASLQANVERINEKAFNSKTFSQELQANPNAVLSAEGLKLAADEKIKVIDFLNEEGKAFIILDDRNLEYFYGEALKNAPSDADADESLKRFRSIRAKAKSDPEFKANLLANTAATLAAEGINAEAAKKIEVIDYEPATHFFMILPPDQQVSRGVGGDAFSWIIDPQQVILSGLITEDEWMMSDAEIVDVIDGRSSRPEFTVLFETSVAISYSAIEAVCWFPRFWGQSCGATATEIKQRYRLKFVESCKRDAMCKKILDN